MPPLTTEEWPARELPQRVLAKPDGRRKKDAYDIDLDKCPLRELVQYRCEPEKIAATGRTAVRCEPIVRTFRRCANFWAETTPLENPGAK